MDQNFTTSIASLQIGSGWYAHALVNGTPITLLVDSGAGTTILDSSALERMGYTRNDLTVDKETYRTANGEVFESMGKLDVDLCIDSVRTRRTVVFAELGSEYGLLGMDYLQQYDCVIHFASGQLCVAGKDVQLHNKPERLPGCRVSLVDDCCVPPRSYLLLQGKLSKPWSEDGSRVTALVEPSVSLPESSGNVRMLPGIVDIDTSLVRVLAVNVGDEHFKLNKGTFLGIAHPTVGEIVNVSSTEEPASLQTSDPTSLPSHLECLIPTATDLTEDQLASVRTVLTKYQDLFVGPDGNLGRTSVTRHRILTKIDKPVRIPPRRLGRDKRKIAEDAVDDMLERGVIEPSSSPYCSPVVLIPKKDGSVRFCVDYRRLNDVTHKDAYPLPRIADIIDSLSGASSFCTLDLASGYWQIEVDPRDREKTAFSIPGKGHYHFNVMPFGLTGAPATFERMMEGILAPLLWNKCLSFLDDVMVFGSDFETTLENLVSVFNCLRQAGLKLKPSKCELFKSSISYLGYVISADGVRCDPRNVSAVKDWPTPQNVSEVRSFLGTANYYRQFVKDFATIESPLTCLTRKKVPFRWTESCQDSFARLRDCLSSAPVLSYPLRDAPFILDTDASDNALGCVLSQIQDGVERVIAYSSTSLNRAQQRYCVTHRELLAVVVGVKRFKPYLSGRKFLLRTDHASLKWLIQFKDPEGMLARWIATLSAFDFDVEHRPGVRHGNADGLSRIPRRRCKRDDCDDCGKLEHPMRISVVQPSNSTSQSPNCNWLEEFSIDQIRDWQAGDTDIGIVIALREKSDIRPAKREILQFSRDCRTLIAQWDLLTVHEGILYRVLLPDKANGHNVTQMIAPKVLRRELYRQLHELRTAGHLGIRKTYQKLKSRFYWPNMKIDIQRWCKYCKSCAQNKTLFGKRQANLRQMLSGNPMDRIAIDFLGPLPRTEKGNEYILVASDYFTKWVECFALPDMRAETTADTLVTQFFCRFGVPRILHSDQGSNFESILFKEMCRLFEIDKTRTTPYHPRSDGMVERFNRTIQQMLRAFVNDRRSDWDEHLPYLCMAYRSTEHASTGFTPNMLMLGRESSLPFDLMLG